MSFLISWDTIRRDEYRKAEYSELGQAKNPKKPGSLLRSDSTGSADFEQPKSKAASVFGKIRNLFKPDPNKKPSSANYKNLERLES